MKIFLCLIVMVLISCSTAPNTNKNSERDVAQSTSNIMQVDGFYCPVRGSNQVSIEDAMSAMPSGSIWFENYITFVTPDDDRLKKYDYENNTTKNENPKSGVFQLMADTSQNTDCFRQIHLTKKKTGSTDTNVWQGYVYIELCGEKKIFTPKKDVLEYAGENELRTRQTLKELWFSDEGGQCTMHVRVPKLDNEDGRDFGVRHEYDFSRTE